MGLYILSSYVTCTCQARFCGSARRWALRPAAPGRARAEMGPAKTQAKRAPSPRGSCGGEKSPTWARRQFCLRNPALSGLPGAKLSLRGRLDFSLSSPGPGSGRETEARSIPGPVFLHRPFWVPPAQPGRPGRGRAGRSRRNKGAVREMNRKPGSPLPRTLVRRRQSHAQPGARRSLARRGAERVGAGPGVAVGDQGASAPAGLALGFS